MDTNNNIQHSKPVPPFVRYCSAIIPTAFDDSLSYYEALCALWKWMQDNLVNVINNNANVTEYYIQIVKDLKSYVENYFDNLDVQEEINNKLDEMAQDGTLDNIILNYLQMNPLITFDTLTDAQSSEQLIEGSTFKTLGKEAINDGYGAIYKAESTPSSIALQNDLYASVVENYGGNNYIEEITVSFGRSNNTDYTIATIPLNDNNGNLISLSVDEDNNTTPLTYAEKNFTTITSNAGLTRLNTSDQWKQGAVISNGVVLHGDECDVPPSSYHSYIGFKEDRSVINIPATASTDTMIAQGVKNAYLTFGQIVVNGVIDIDPNVDADQVNPMNCVGVKNDGTILIIATEGRTERNVGMSITQVATLMLGLGCTNVWRCDGGGSTSLIYKGSKQNRNIDDHSTTDRNIHVTLNFKKETIDKQLAEVYSFIGKERQLLNRQILRDTYDRYEAKRSWANYFNFHTGYNKMTSAGTWTNLQFEDSLSHYRSDSWDLIKDEDSNRTIGIKIKKAGLYEFSFNCIIQCANTAGERGLRIDSPLGTAMNSHCSSTSYFAPHAANDGFEKNLITSVNAVVDQEIYFCGKGQINDDFNRTNLVIKEIGVVDSAS